MIYFCLSRLRIVPCAWVLLVALSFVPALAAAEKQINNAEFTYSPIGKRDPFESLLNRERESREKVPEQQLTPIQKFALGQFKLQAVLIGKGAPKAMLRAPDGKTYIVTPGTKIGKRSGVITDITGSGIHVEEVDYDNFTGAEKKENMLIRMPEQKTF